MMLLVVTMYLMIEVLTAVFEDMISNLPGT
jgi:hypothetical protein